MFDHMSSISSVMTLIFLKIVPFILYKNRFSDKHILFVALNYCYLYIEEIFHYESISAVL